MARQSGFTTAIGADNGHKLPLLNGQVHPIQCLDLVTIAIRIIMLQIFYLNHRIASYCS